jgi:CubicO group peptidase (beta-lactamase class C family)
LLGAVIEAAAREDYANVVKRQVLDPVGMSHTSLDGSVPPGRSELAHPYQLGSGNAVADAPPMDLSDRWPAGGWTSTALDLAKFAAASIEGPLLTQSIRTIMFAPQSTTGGQITSVGLGWRIGKDSSGRRFVHHGGDAIGGRAFVLAYPDDGLVMAMVSNLGLAGFAEREAQMIAGLFLK